MGAITRRCGVSVMVVWALAMPRVVLAEGLTRESLQAAYTNVRTLSADIEQTKSSPYLFKPLVSTIHLEYANGRIVWRVLEPVRGELVFDEGKISSDVPGLLPPGAAERMIPLMRLFRAIFSVDLAAIEQDFDLRFSANVLEAQSRAGSQLTLVKKLVFQFAPNLFPERITVDVEGETTELRFLRFELSRGGAAKATP